MATTGLVVVIKGDATQMQGELNALKASAARLGVEMTVAAKAAVSAGTGSVNVFAMREVLVLMREISRGNWTRVPGSLALLISRMGLFGNLLKNGIGLLAGWALGIAAVGVAAYFTIRHFIELARSAENLREVMDLTTIKFTDQVAAFRKATEETQAFNDWLLTLGKTEETLAEKVEDTVDAMKQQARYEREIAEQRGASKGQLAAMDLAAERRELEFLTKARDEASAELARNAAASKAAFEAASDQGGRSATKNAVEHMDTMSKVVEALQGKTKTSQVRTEFMTDRGPVPSFRAAQSSDAFSIKVGEKDFTMSLDEATEKFKQLAKTASELSMAEKQRDDLAASTKKNTEQSNSEFEKLNKQIRQLQTKIAIDSEYLGVAGSAQSATHRASHASVTSLQRIGGYGGPAVMIDIARKSLNHLASIDKKTGGSAGGMGGAFGGGHH